MRQDTTTTTTSASPRTTGAPWITLVDIEGFAVPDCERYSPVCPPDPAEMGAEAWGAWADVWRYELGPEPIDDDDYEDIGPTAADWAEYGRYSAELDARRECERDARECEESWARAKAEEAARLDADYRAWAIGLNILPDDDDEIEAQREWYRRNTLADFNAQRTD